MTFRRLAASAGLAGCIFATSVRADTSVTTDPVGFITLNAAGTGGTSSSALSFLGLSFTRPVEYQGAAASASGATLFDNNAAWTDNQFNAPNGTFYLELTSGTGTGLMANITASSASNKSLTLAADLSAYISAGTTYKIRKNWTVASLFGPNDESGLQGGNATSADQILVYNSAAKNYTTYYYQTSGLGGVGWRTTSSTSADASGAAFNPTDGMIIRRFQSSSVAFSIAGAVKLGQTDIPVASGLNVVSNVYPTNTLTLGNSGLLASGLNGGTATSADEVQIYSAGAYSTYYYQTSGLGGTGWRSTTSTSADASSTVIPPGASVIVQRTNNAAPFTWSVPQPF
jgi:uncharacterized protein (TIGR02597 family)